MPAGLVLLEKGGGLLGEGGRHRWTPTLHSMSSSIFLLGPFRLDMHTQHRQQREKMERDKDREREMEEERESKNRSQLLAIIMHLKKYNQQTTENSFYHHFCFRASSGWFHTQWASFSIHSYEDISFYLFYFFGQIVLIFYKKNQSEFF